MARTAILVAVLLFSGALFGLTVSVIVDDGVDVLTGLSLLVVGLFLFGIVGALRHPPEE